MLTPERLSDDALAAIEQRLNAATPGPWYCEVDGWPVRNVADGNRGGSVPWWASGIDNSEGNPYRPYVISFGTLEFTASAREDVAALLAEVKELRACISEIDQTLRVPAAEYVPAIGDVFTLIDKLKGTDPMSDELRQAAELCVGSHRNPRGEHDWGLPDAALLLARDYLATHRADDGVAVDEAWLRSVGFVNGRDLDLPGEFVLTAYDNMTWSISIANDDAWYGCEHTMDVPQPKTRGDVRQLCRVLGVPLKEADDG